MLEASQLTCIRDRRVLFENLDMVLQPGQIIQVEGPNGAGKTSLLRTLCGLTQPRRGTVRWCGEDIRRCRPAYYRMLLYLGHNPGIKQDLTPLENLRFFRSLGGHRGSDDHLEDALQRVGLYGYEDVAVRTLSAGQKRRVALARLWLTTASLWVLDEPFTAIDSRGIHHLENRLKQHIEHAGMVLLTSHQPLHLDGCSLQRLALI